MKQYDDNQYYDQGDAELGTGFTNYERLLLELNYKNYYPNKTTAEMTGNKDYEGLKSDRIRVYEKILNECGLDPEANYDKNTDHAKLLEAAYTILHSLLGNIDAYRKVETEFVTASAAFTNLQNRLKELRSEIERVKAEMHYQDSDFTFMFYTR